MKTLITFFVLVIPAISIMHHFVMKSVEGYDGYGDRSHQTRRFDQISFETYMREQGQRVGK
jgi:hypothetical protein